jgi:thioredoxin-like negative regulator of GroEL
MRPIVHGLAKEYAGRIQFLYLDVRDPRNNDAKRRFGYRATPHFVLLSSDARVVREHSGLLAPADLEVWLKAALTF